MTTLITTIEPLRDVHHFEMWWRNLEPEGLGSNSFFFSWDWASTAIAAFDGSIYVSVTRTNDNRIVGLGLFYEITETRHGVIRIRQLRLNETGLDATQTVPIEYNSILTERGFENQVWQSVIAAFQQCKSPHWDEIIVSNALTSTEETSKKLNKMNYRRAEYSSGLVDLSALRKKAIHNRDGYIASLGRNTRSQIRRSIRLYEEQGPLTLSRASTLFQAKEFLASLGSLHEAKWRARGAPGIMSNQYFWAFHNALIERCFDKGSVELLRVCAGDNPIGWLYNFVERERVLFNIGGFQAESDNKYKPGLVTQVLAIESHLQNGKSIYDFLAGSDRYKLNLGTRGADMVSFAIQRKKTESDGRTCGAMGQKPITKEKTWHRVSIGRRQKLMITPSSKNQHLAYVTLVNPTSIDDTLRAEWLDLGLNLETPNPFFLQWFLEPALRHLDQDKTVQLCIVRRKHDDFLIGLAPFNIASGYAKLPIKYYSVWKHDHCYNCAPLIRKDHAASFYEALTGWIDKRPSGAKFMRFAMHPLDKHNKCVQFLIGNRRIHTQYSIARAVIRQGDDFKSHMERVYSGKKKKGIAAANFAIW